MVKPTLMPETVKGYLWPRYSRTPSPPPTPTMNPPLVKTTATWPVSARDGVLKPATPTRKATRAALMPNFFMRFFPLKSHAPISQHLGTDRERELIVAFPCGLGVV